VDRAASICYHGNNNLTTVQSANKERSMKASRIAAFVVAALFPMAWGCAQNDAPPPDKEAKIKASLDQLEPADRQLAQEQKNCAVETENRLGSMGKPVKVILKGQPVFLCCKGCKDTAEKNPDKTLDTVKRLKAGNGASRQP
jgi:hypothetical protein